MKKRKGDESGAKDSETQKRVKKKKKKEERGVEISPEALSSYLDRQTNRGVSLPTPLTKVIQIHWLLPTSICRADQAFLNISSWENSKRILWP